MMMMTQTDDDSYCVEAMHPKAALSQPKSFIAIFGIKGKGMKVVIAVRVVLDFGYKFPETLAGGKSSGTARGKVDLTTFVEGEGVRMSTMEDDDGFVKIDYEAFIQAMKRDRAWDKPKAHEEWAILEANAETVRDQKGLKGSARLHVPSNYFIGLDRNFKRTDDYQFREMQDKKVFKAPMATGDRERLREELARGFRARSAVDKDRLHEALPQSAMSSTVQTQENAQSSGLASILNEFAPSAGPQGSDQKQNAESGSAETAVETAAADAVQRDVGAARNKAGAKALRDLNAWIAKFTTGVIEAFAATEKDHDEIRPVHDQAFMNTLNERMTFSCIFLGVKVERLPASSAKSRKDLVYTDFQVVTYDFAARALGLKAEVGDEEENKVEKKAFFTAPDTATMTEDARTEAVEKWHNDIHSHLFTLQKKLMKDPMCDDHTTLPTVPELRLEVAKIGEVKNADELDKQSKLVDHQITRMKQGKKSLGTAQSDLKRQVANRQREIAKKESDQKKGEEEKLKAQKAQDEQLEQKRIGKMKAAPSFQLDFSAHAAVEVVTVNAEMDKTKVSALKPCIFRLPEATWQHLKPVKKETGSAEAADPTAIQACMDMWQTQFPNFEAFKSKDRASAPLYEQHGKNDVIDFFKKVMGDVGMGQVDCTDYPALERTFKNAFLWAYSEVMVLFASEPDQLPNLRFILGGSVFFVEPSRNTNLRGELSVIMAEPNEIKMMMRDEAEPSLSDMLRYMKTLTPDAVKLCKDKACNLYHVNAQPGDVVYTPAGYLTGVTINNRHHAYGLRQSILPSLNSQKTAQQITSLSAMQKAIKADKDMTEDGLVLNTVVSFLDLYIGKDPLASDDKEPAAKKARTEETDLDRRLKARPCFFLTKYDT